jgi:hypothetical protein
MPSTPTIARSSATAAALALLAVPLAAVPAYAGDDDREVRASRACAGGQVKVKAKEDDGRIEVEGEVDTNRRGQDWRWTMRRDGDLVARGTGTTAGASGSFDVERKIADRAGSDRIVFRAVRGGTTCSVAVTY